MGRIQKLSPSLVNRIAAGECVERPASVVKELVENALDAGAQSVEIDIEDGGRTLIRVSDDGCGMGVDDLELCIASHATSKIAADDDLFAIRTMGFRGEALPSIASVARLRIISREPNADVAHELTVEAGELTPPKPVNAPVGTMVEVRDLFFSVPARRKFLRTNQTESGHVTEQLARIALAHHDVGFKLTSNGRTVHNLPVAETRRQRIADFYGSELADPLMPIERGGNDVLVEGLIAPPAHCRKSTKWEYCFVNGRYVRDRFVTHAVREAYRSLIQNEYPVVFLYLTVDPAALDVNVHPTKVEVRWRDSNFVHQQVLAAIREKFLSTNLDRPFKLRSRDEEDDRERVRTAMVDFFSKRIERRVAEPATQPQHAASAPGNRQADSAGAFSRPPLTDIGGHAQRIEASAAVVNRPTVPVDAETHASAKEQTSAARATIDENAEPIPRAIQLHNTYLIFEEDDGVTIVDQHALHERILYEEFCARILDKPLESQRLLMPDIVRVPAEQIEVLSEHTDVLARLGIELSVAGPQSIAVQAFPSFLERVDRSAFASELVNLLFEKGAQANAETLVHDVIDMMSCKAAVKAGDPLTDDEIRALLARRETAARSSHCPHGRPTTLHLSLVDLEKQFKRR